MDNRPIGIFDSGFGGLTSVSEINYLMPNEDIIYFGDTGRVPYGTRSSSVIIKYVRQDINFLLSKNVKIIICACGTASSVALCELEKYYDVKLIGVIEPSSLRAAKISKNKRIGVLGTQKTISSGKCEQILKSIDKNIIVFSKACPMFVALVENGYIKGEVTDLIAKEYLDDFKKKSIDTIILACTHFPLIKETIEKNIIGNTNIIDSGACASQEVKDFLSKNNMTCDKQKIGKIKYFVSDSCENFKKVGKIFLKREISDCIDKIEIEKY